MPTIMAPLTPVQLAPVITLRVSGEVRPLLRFFSIDDICAGTVAKAQYRSTAAPLISDDVLIVYFKAPRSYTGEDVLEISFHGNPVIVNAAMADFASLGVRMAEAGEFTRRALMNNKLTLSQAEAVNALIHAPTAAGVASAHHTLYGELDALFNTLRDDLVAVLSQLEAAIDFSEELHELQEEAFTDRISKASAVLDKLINSFYDAQRAVKGVQVVITGAPNAGKSTLFNKLLGSERAIVSDEAGTTRDIITEQLHVGSVHIKLTDTAGLRQSDSAAESEGVRRALSALEKADLVLILADLSSPTPTDTENIINTPLRKKLIIGTKADLPVNNALTCDIKISYKDKDSLNALRQLIGQRVEALIPAGDIGPALLAEAQRLECETARDSLKEAENSPTLDLQAYYLQQALKALDRSSGRDTTEDVLDRLFVSFCIGK